MPCLKKIIDLVPSGVRPYCMGLLSWVPGAVISGELPRPEGFDKARYAYSVWLRHLILASPNLVSFPKAIIELGPGDSLGVGLAALISGSNTIYAFDSERFIHDSQETVKTFDNLVRLFSEQAKIPDVHEFPEMKPLLESCMFPSSILPDQSLAASLEPRRLFSIRNSLLNKNSPSTDEAIYYFTKECATPPIALNSVDMVISQAVMEHVDDIMKMYRELYSWLKPGGLMSHMIDFRSHSITKDWNGHWRYSESQWKIIEGKRYKFLNREPYSKHLTAIRETGFSIVNTITYQLEESVSSPQHYKYGELSHGDTITMAALIQAIKPLK
jgi:hypothetical protein